MTDSIALLSSAPVTRLHDVFDGWEGGGAELGWALLTGTLFPCHCTRPERNSLGLYLREGLSGCTPVRFAMATLSGCTPLTGSLHGSLFPLRFPYGSFIFMPCHTQQTACNTVLSYLLEINDELLIEILQVRHKRILGTAQTNAQACHKRIVGRFKNVTDESLSTAQTNAYAQHKQMLRTLVYKHFFPQSCLHLRDLIASRFSLQTRTSICCGFPLLPLNLNYEIRQSVNRGLF